VLFSISIDPSNGFIKDGITLSSDKHGFILSHLEIPKLRDACLRVLMDNIDGE